MLPAPLLHGPASSPPWGRPAFWCKRSPRLPGETRVLQRSVCRVATLWLTFCSPGYLHPAKLPPGDTLLIPQRTMAPTPAPHADSAPGAMDLIFIEGLTGQTVIGIHDSELHRPQPLVIDVHAGLPRSRACDTDEIRDTIDYGVVRERLLRLMAEHNIKLLEAFAEAIADILIGEFGASWVRVKVVKPQKFEDVAAVG
eukprot:gene40287-53253_t